LGIGNIYSVEQIGDVLVFGGYGKSLIRAVDTVKKSLLPGTFKTGIKHVYSLSKCELPGKKLYLSVSGGSPSYSGDQTDIYDVTDLGKTFNYSFLQLKEENSSKSDTQYVTQCSCNPKKIIETLLIKIEHYLEVFATSMLRHFNNKNFFTMSMVFFNIFYEIKNVLSIYFKFADSKEIRNDQNSLKEKLHKIIKDFKHQQWGKEN
jgi:hypothetical protein